MGKLAVCIAALLCTATSAFAANIAQPESFNWTGFYLGGSRGMDFARMSYLSDEPATEHGKFDQVLAGGVIGYDQQIGNIVLGLEADVYAKFGAGTLDAVKSRPTSDWDLSVRPRLGYLVTPRALAYVTGGLAVGHFDTPLHEDDPPDEMDLLGGTRTGWTAGGGLQYAFDSNFSGRLEYRYTDWGKEKVNGAPAGDPPFETTSKLTDQRVLVSLIYKLGESTTSQADTEHDWNGFYIGAHGGGSAGYFIYDDGYGAGGEEYGDFTQELIGGHIGYNFVTNSILLGLEGDINAKFGHGFKYDDNLRPTSDWDGSIRARFGVLPTPQSLLYVTGGFAVGNFKTPHVGTEEAAEEHLGGSRTGWTLGGGTEYAFSNNWTAGIEYRYTDWGTKKLDNYPRDFGDPPGACQCDVPTKLTDNRVTVSLSYEF